MGFDWHGADDYLVAEPEKALVDCLYLASRKGRNFKYFPEMDMKQLKTRSIKHWVDLIKNERIRKAVLVSLALTPIFRLRTY